MLRGVKPTHPRPSHIAFAAFVAAAVLTSLHAQEKSAPRSKDLEKDDTVRLEEIEVSAPHTSALSAAPTDSRLDVTQPQSVIGIQFIANSVTPTADYASIANLTPSVSNVQINGPGLSESKHLTMRGIDDGGYNVTYDGIPFGDINDFTHHTTSYFPAKMLGQVVVDRGPGTASTIGEATFGGTIALFSKDPRREASLVPTASYGSWNTFLGHLEANTGTIGQLGGASAIGSAQYIHSDGYRTNADMWRRTYYVKYLQPIGRSTTLTFLGNYNNIKFHNPDTVTQAQIDTLGRNYGLGNDRTKTDFWGYNFQAKQADMYYLGLDTRFGQGWRVQDKFYTYAYNNESHESPVLGTNASKTNFGGRFKVNRYRAWGDQLVLSHADDVGTFKTGLWWEWTRNPRYQYNIDYSLPYGSGPDRQEAIDVKAGSAIASAYQYDMVNFLRTAQPFAEYDWHVTRDLALNGGVRYVDFTREIQAPINQTTKVPLYYTKRATKTLPLLSANYRLSNDWSAYAQFAKGFLAPNLNQFYVPRPENNRIQPQETTNYQLGTVFKHDRFNADVDVYWIDFKHYPVTIPNAADSNNPIYTMASGAYYSGIEAQATYQLGLGFNAYANGSINRAEFKKSKLDVNNAPKSTAALGLVYSNGGFFGSIIDKYSGPLTAYSGSLNPDVASTAGLSKRDPGYWLTDLAVGYGVKLGRRDLRSFKVKFQVNNLFDREVQVLHSVNASGVGKFNVLPTRNYFLTVASEF
jgi:iron complex outermembrane receptor protein